MSRHHFGINKKIINTIHNIMLFSMLHSSFVAPAQEIVIAYLDQQPGLEYIASRPPITQEKVISAPAFCNDTSQQECVGHASKYPEHVKVLKETNYYPENTEAESRIGVSNEFPLDDPSDNLFKVKLDTLPNINDKVLLTYELFGVNDQNGVSRSINDRLSLGGYMVKKQNGWSKQTEELDASWLQKGENKIMFNTPKGASHTYKIKNLRVKIEKGNPDSALLSEKIILQTKNINLKKDNRVYIKGFIKSNSNISLKIMAGHTELEMHSNEFEGFVMLDKETISNNFITVNAYGPDGIIAQQFINLDTLIEADNAYAIEESYKSEMFQVKAFTASFYSIPGASLKISDSSMTSDKTVSITPLRRVDIAPMESGMVNVTKGRKAFRFLPDGTKFSNPVKITIAYDTLLLPSGYTPKDIKTFYFDTNSRHWVAVKTDTVDIKNHTVTAMTTHFTDYINGIIQSPESPQTSSFAPTAMSDIKAVDPSSEMTLISPPEVSQRGDANLSYPIKIPAGRNGMQPQLGIQYNSDAGNGWLGQGWNLNTPAITIDTKWGSPSFHLTDESEIYSLSGEQLMYPKKNEQDWMPNRHTDVNLTGGGTGYDTSPMLRSYATKNNIKIFTPRKQGNFAKIERIGSATSNYYWKVTNTDGTISWYGGKNAVEPNAVIKNGAGDIVHWALYLTQDIFGNTVKYEYTPINERVINGLTGTNANINGGIFFHINKILYTGYNEADYKYEVSFKSATTLREDISINAKQGVKQVEPYFLENIIIKNIVNQEIIRKYKFDLEYGVFKKGRLVSISELNKDNQVFYKHTFDYYNDIFHEGAKGQMAMYEEPVTINLPTPQRPNFTLGIHNLFGSSKLGTNQTFDYGWEIRPSIGLQIKWKNISQDPYKTINFGLPFGMSYSKSNGIIAMVDIDGNGLDDIVYRTSSGLKYFPNFYDVNTNSTVFGEEMDINGINHFSRSDTETQNKFFESWDLKMQLPWASKRFHVGKRRFVAKNHTNVYFTDANGDGLIDIVKDENVVFNKGLNENNIIEFETSSEKTPNMLITANSDTIPGVESEDEITNEGAYDVVRVWVAPKDGTISITDILALKNENEELSLSPNSRAVYSIETQKQGINNGAPFRIYLKELTNAIRTANVSVNNYNGNSPSLGSNNSNVVNVVKGQRFYFRLKSEPNSKKTTLNSNPTIAYISSASTDYAYYDENLENHKSVNYADAFLLNGDQPFEVPKNGTVKIEWNPFFISNLSDNVKFEIIKTTSTEATDGPDVEQVIYSKTFNSGASGNLTPSVFDAGQNVSIPMSVNLGNPETPNSVIYQFRVSSDSNIKWKANQWLPKITFVPTVPVDGITEIIRYPIAEHTVYKSAFSNKISTNPNWITTNVATNYGIKLKTNVNLGPDKAGDFIMVVKKEGVLVGKRTITVDIAGAISVSNSNSPIVINTPINISNSAEQYRYTVGFYTDNYQDSALINDYILATNNTPALLGYNWSMPLDSNYFLPISVENCYNDLERFGSMNKEWGQFFYNDIFDRTSLMPSDNYGKLLNSFYINKTFTADVTQYSNVNCGNIGDPGYEECAENANINNQNPGQYEDPDTISDEIPDDPMYDEINPVFMIANPLRNNIILKKGPEIIERWQGAFDSQYSQPNKFYSGSFEDSVYGSIFQDETPDQVVQADLFTGMPAITKIVQSVSTSKNTGWSPLSQTKNETRYSNQDSNFIDINGDGYPDIISADNIKLTRKTGGFFDTTNHNFGVSSSNNNRGKTLTLFGYGSASGTSDHGDFGESLSEGNPVARLTNFPVQPSLSLSTSNKEVIYWQDINGDGLPDKVVNINDNYFYRLNTGNINSSINYENFNLLSSNESSPNPVSLSVGIPIPLGSLINLNNLPFSINFSAGASFSGSSTKTMLLDVNGDGLADLLSDGYYKLNSGNGFIDETIPLNTPGNLTDIKNDNKSSTATISGEASRFFRVYSWFRIKWLRFFHIKAGITASGNASLTLSDTKKTFKDFNGDGYLDIIEKSDNNIKVYYSRIGRTDKLSAVTNPLGGKFTIDYKAQKIDYNNPHSKWAMSSLIVQDGYDKSNDGNDNYRKDFIYENAKYDRREREFYGYETVKVVDYFLDERNLPGEAYRTSVSKYHNNSYFFSGLLKESYTIKGNDENQKYSRTQNLYKLYALNGNNDEINLMSPLPDTFDVGGKEGRRSAAILLTETSTELYELASSPQITTAISMEYDKKGRIIKYINTGNVNDTSDDYASTIEYHGSMDGLNIINVPKSIKVITPSSGQLRYRKTDVNPSNGKIIKISAQNSGIWAETSMEYNQYGNLSLIKYPANNAGQSMSYKYDYDSVYNKYVAKITDAFGYVSSATYNANFDKPIETIDLAGNKMKYEYDLFGRNTKTIGPKEIAAGKPYTIKFEYYPYFSLLPSGTAVNIDSFVPVAVTSHYDQQNPANDIQTYTFVDGLARPIQVKKDILYNIGGSDSPEYIEALSVSGKTSYDQFGRTVEQYHPWWEAKVDELKFLLNEYESPYFSAVEYDELDRAVRNIDPVGNFVTTVYSLGTDVDGIISIKTRTDASQDGMQHVITETYKDVSDKVISTNNLGGTNGEIWTRFKYNEIGELMSYIDDEGLETKYKYDALGRKIEINHPDNGKTTFRYDNVNLIALQTANLESQGQLINYEYEFNRLLKIIYPPTPSGPNLANVVYRYGTSGNQKGRLAYQQDASGYQTFAYGNMGEIITNTRTVIGPNIPTRQFKTTFTYDSWNRVQRIGYPDSEKVYYSYDLGGNLTKIQGTFQDGNYDYLKRIDYDHYEQRKYVVYGNGTDMSYTYSPELRRLDNLVSRTSNQSEMFNNIYSYDWVGNIVGVNNEAGVNSTNNMGGTYQSSYFYDTLNRLTYAAGDFIGHKTQKDRGNDSNSEYDLNLEYNNTHGIKEKRQWHLKNGNEFQPNTYKSTYSYYPGTHKLSTISDIPTGNIIETFNYDANGNIAQRIVNGASEQKYLWDESNRLRAVDDVNGLQHYIYDAGGERILKASSEMVQLYENGSLVDQSGVTFNSYKTYPNAYIVVDGNAQYSKHYYAGTERIVSRIGDQDVSYFEPLTPEPGGPITRLKSDSEPEFDADKLRQAQINDLQNLAKTLNKGKVSFKESKSTQPEETAKNEGGDIERPVPGNIYFFHPDHLGTATYLTDINGNPYQFFLNLPFGETMAEQHSQTEEYENPYKFNGKELDQETGLYYYGARYYDPRVSIWMSTDPMMEKYPNESPYIYCGNNPIIFIDPDGRDRIYSASGRLLEDTGKGSLIKVQIGDNRRNLSELNYKSRGTRIAVSKIIAKEASLRGYKGYYGVKSMENEDAGAYTNTAKTVFVNSKQLSKGSFDDYHDLGSVIDHEEGHKNENISQKDYTFVNHANVYLGQSQTTDFNNTSEDNKYSVAAGFVVRSYNAYLNKEISFDDLKSNVGNFNKLNTKNGVQIKSEFDGNGVNVQVGKKTHGVDLKRLKNPQN